MKIKIQIAIAILLCANHGTALADTIFTVRQPIAAEIALIEQLEFAAELPGGPPLESQVPENMSMSNSQVLAVNDIAILAHLQDLGWRDYGLDAPTGPPVFSIAPGRAVTLDNKELLWSFENTAAIVGNADGAETLSMIIVRDERIVGGRIHVDDKFFEIVASGPDTNLPGPSALTLVEIGWQFIDEAKSQAIDTQPPSDGSTRPQPPVFVAADSLSTVATGMDEPTDGDGDAPVTGVTIPADEIPLPIDDDLPTPDAPAEDTSIEEIKVLVVYTADLKSEVNGYVGAQVNLAVADTNQTYQSGGINQELTLVAFEEVDYEESGNINLDLKRLVTADDGHMDDVIDRWRETEADIVSLWVADADFPGVAYTLKNVTTSFAPCAANVVRFPAAILNFSFAHELGHNMGARHDIEQTPENLPYPHAHGIVEEQVVSIMSYPVGSCDFAFCKRRNEFSDPDNGFGDPVSANNRLTLNKTASTVAKFNTQHDLLGSCGD